jgi:hypothetical protein
MRLTAPSDTNGAAHDLAAKLLNDRLGNAAAEEFVMTLEDDARKCCEDIEEVGNDVERVRKAGAEDAKQHLEKLDSKLQRFLAEAREVRRKLDAGIREGLDGLVTAWRDGRNRLSAHLRLIEATSTLASAQRLANEGHYVEAESALAGALRLAQDARELLGTEDARLNELVEKLEYTIREIKYQGEAAATRLEGVVAANERFLADLEG